MARKGARPQIKEASKQTDMTSNCHAKGARPQIKKASKQTDVTTKRHAEVARPQIKESSKHVPDGAYNGPCPLTKEASKQTYVT